MTHHPISLSRLFATAADRLETDGWTTGHHRGSPWGTSTTSRACAEGVLAKAAVVTGADRIALARAFAVLADVLRGPIAAWNDEPFRTKADVVLVLRACARAAHVAETEPAGPAPIAIDWDAALVHLLASQPSEGASREHQ